MREKFIWNSRKTHCRVLERVLERASGFFFEIGLKFQCKRDTPLKCRFPNETEYQLYLRNYIAINTHSDGGRALPAVKAAR